jgi:hypothetical protein
MKSEIVTNPNPDTTRVLKTATCPSLSGKSKLTYQVGCKVDGQIQLQVQSNTGKGYFSKEWVALNSISVLLSKVPAGKFITSASFKSLFKGKSVNTAGFLTAVMRHEGLIRPMKDKRRCYELLDAADFIAEVNALMESSVGAGGTAKPKPEKKATATVQKTAIQKQPGKTKAQKA